MNDRAVETWLIDCWPCCLFSLMALSVPSAPLFRPLRSIQNPVNRCCRVHRRLLSCCFTENHSMRFRRELDPRLQTLTCSMLTLEYSDCAAVFCGAETAFPCPAPLTTLLFLQGSNKTGPLATPLLRVQQPGSHSAAKREKRLSTSSFQVSANRELQKLLALAGTHPSVNSPGSNLLFFTRSSFTFPLLCNNLISFPGNKARWL